MQCIHIQKLMPLAEAFANGFVLEKRTHLGVFLGQNKHSLRSHEGHEVRIHRADVDIAGRRWHGESGLHAAYIMKNILSLGVALTVLALSARGSDAPAEKSADELWQTIQTLEQVAPPRDRAHIIERMGQLHTALLTFERNFPSDPRHWDAKLGRLEVEAGLAKADGQPTNVAELLALTKEIIAAPDASAETKADARYVAAERRVEMLDASGSATNGAARAAADVAILELRQLYPDDLRTVRIQFDMAGILEVSDPAAAESILHGLATSTNAQVAAMAQQQLEALKFSQKLAKEPLDLKFEAVDGTTVDLAKLRGKVVLLDFWATWCGPCRMEIPNVVATYNGLHSQGFEIVGISLDQSKEQMVKFTKAAGMTWPEYFDGKSWGNDISTRYGITAIPTAWLLDKKGMVRSTEARGGNLGEQVKKLLAE